MKSLLQAHAMCAESACFDSIKRLATVAALTLFLVSLGMAWPSTAKAQGSQRAATATLIVKHIAGLSAEEQGAIVGRNGGAEKRAINSLRLHVIEVPAAQVDNVQG